LPIALRHNEELRHMLMKTSVDWVKCQPIHIGGLGSLSSVHSCMLDESGFAREPGLEVAIAGLSEGWLPLMFRLAGAMSAGGDSMAGRSPDQLNTIGSGGVTP
jgi:hypothetical protein